ncbi:P-loop containing nucleoside triphosphate hydrolase protein [Annulohypoxylon maeteangense]|uniref:P-loop containing nucleoside triphosphate hydrolase protein n=1 Tax=Annulohypoxylon maeteangense TaxID=1927788 RepID=UPI002007903A|nr:P-loop containing nucleoside triphosphate hydrolase protein [Annulohypoxylon maeteangense]KAI0886792.1 P-loop containing nucleoside triphosphate hydrolase protein [Annulohypoxylon maeteangense]
MENYGFSNIRKSDMVILVMGITGSGKSSFISTVLEEDVDIIGHNLTSHTSGVDFFTLEYDDGRRVFLMDTPGFDDTYRSNAEVLKDIAFVLAQVYRHKLNLAGVVYLHRITDNRVSGSSVKNIDILRKLCGIHAFPRVVLTSSMWDSIDQDAILLQKAFCNEDQLKNTENFWGSLVDGGSHVMRWTGDKESALGAISHLINLHDLHGSIVLKIQQELVDDGINLNDTEVGRAVQDVFVQALAKHQDDLRDITSQFRQTLRDGNNKMALELQETLNATRKQIESIESSQSTIQTSLEKLANDKTKEYSRVLAQVQEDQRLMMKMMKQCQDDYQRLIEEEKANMEILREAQRESELERFSQADTLSDTSDSEDEVDEELRKQIEEEQAELAESKADLDKKMRRQRRKMLVKKNSVPMLSILAGIGATVGGGLLINPGLIAAGVGLMASGASKLDFSKKPYTREEEPPPTTESMISLASDVD